MHIRGSIAAIRESITKMTCIIGEFTDGTRQLHDSIESFKF